MRSLTFRDPLRNRPVGSPAGEAPGPGGPGGAGASLRQPLGIEQPARFAESVDIEEPVGFGEPVTVGQPPGPGQQVIDGQPVVDRQPMGDGPPLGDAEAAGDGEAGVFAEPVSPRGSAGPEGRRSPDVPVSREARPPRGEDDAVRDVLGRLCRAYGFLDGATVEQAVEEAREAFRQARIRAFVPILVERRARAALDTAARRPRPAPREGNPLSAP